MMTGSLKRKRKKGGCSVIRACSLIRSNTVFKKNYIRNIQKSSTDVNKRVCTCTTTIHLEDALYHAAIDAALPQ